MCMCDYRISLFMQSLCDNIGFNGLPIHTVYADTSAPTTSTYTHVDHKHFTLHTMREHFVTYTVTMVTIQLTSMDTY